MTIFFEDYVDQRAMKYPFLQTPHALVGLIGFYLFAIYAGKKLMINRRPFDLKTFVALYNIALVGVCIYLIKLAFAGKFRYDYLWRCYGVDYKSQKEEDLTMISMCYFACLSKALELVETIVFVLRKKNNQVSFLHVYHHVSTLIFAWVFARSIGGGMQSFSFVINLMAHVVMYSYYFLTSLGPTVSKRLHGIKKYITAVQITQICLILVNICAAIRCENSSKKIIWFYMPNVCLILYMFVTFFRKNYVETRKLKNAK